MISRVNFCPLNSGFILLFGLGEVLAVMNIHVTQHTIDYCIIATDNHIYSPIRIARCAFSQYIFKMYLFVQY